MNRVFIAASIDGYIADKDGSLDWLHSIDNPDQIDMGYAGFMNSIDALVMGRVSYETVRGFDIDWPYEKPVFVLSSTLTDVPDDLKGRVAFYSGNLTDILNDLKAKGFKNFYIDGGKTIQSFLKEDLIDEMVITIIPYVLGGGTLLFGDLKEKLKFQCIKSELFLDSVVQNTFVRKR